MREDGWIEFQRNFQNVQYKADILKLWNKNLDHFRIYIVFITNILKRNINCLFRKEDEDFSIRRQMMGSM